MMGSEAGPCPEIGDVARVRLAGNPNGLATMIVRVLTATVPEASSVRLHDLMREQLPILKSYDGLVYVKLARRLIGKFEEVVLYEEWRDPAAMYAWTGPDISRARLAPGAEALIADLVITHYEALDIEDPFSMLEPQEQATGP